MGAEVKWHAAVFLQLKLSYTCARMVFYPAELNQLGASVQCLNQVCVEKWTCINVQEFVLQKRLADNRIRKGLVLAGTKYYCLFLSPLFFSYSVFV